ncbi:hypothetical protein [Arthrobacter sp.]|uniref:hypothetical protein n=1 Tax=Arthrobacter sp. TaxID=1667 RepID=UPI0026DF9FFB|nr:hypothetical protein [Arthrobacter sp.]MDO5753094.1 hypothetical protein [Arthrobacter sp.]
MGSTVGSIESVGTFDAGARVPLAAAPGVVVAETAVVAGEGAVADGVGLPVQPAKIKAPVASTAVIDHFPMLRMVTSR